MPPCPGRSRTSRPAPRTRRLAGLWLLLALTLPTARAGIAEPDNIVYGRITLEGEPVTAARTDVVVEARRTPDGPAVATYRMGEDRRAGDFYKLRLKLEHAAPLAAVEASLTGDRLHLVALTAAGPVSQASVDVGQRGQILRLDLDTANPDQDENGLLDEWEMLYFGRTGNDPADDPDADGRTNLKEFLDGTDPRVPNIHKLTGVTLKAGNRVELQAIGLPGKTYVIQATDDPGSGNWQTVAQQTAPANGQFSVEQQEPASRTARYYRSVEQ